MKTKEFHAPSRIASTASPKSGVTNYVSFSGMDGAGKTTQIEALCARMKEDGLQVVVIRFWDDIAKLTQLREVAGHAIFKGDKGVGTPSAPIHRRDKNVRSSLMTLVRLFLYSIDAVSIRFAVKMAMRSQADLVIFDRYIYDELANLSLTNPAIRAYVWLIMKVVPKPHISYLLDADPVKARARKPEYPIEFLYTSRRSYLSLNDLIGGLTVICPMSIEDVQRTVLCYARRSLMFSAPQHKESGGAASIDDCKEPPKLDSPQTGSAAF
jgi:thymidylate kinase